MIEIDSGYHRSGVAPELAGQLAIAAASVGLDVRGIFTFPGQGYGPGRANVAAADEAHALRSATRVAVRGGNRTRDHQRGIDTHSCVDTPWNRNGGATGELCLQRCPAARARLVTRADIALSAWATVVSRASGQFVLDAGSKVLGRTGPRGPAGTEGSLDYPEARLIALSEHHATVAWPGDLALPALGTLLRVVPNHVCSAVNLANELVVMRDGVVVDCWRVAARGANS